VSQLVRYDAMCRAIDAAYAVDEVKAIHDHAQMLQAAARVAKNVDTETRAYEIRMRAARKTGALSKKIEKVITGRPKASAQAGDFPDTKAKVLSDAGISTQQASEWERLSDVPEEEFEAALPTMSVRELIDKPTSAQDEVIAKGVELARRVNDVSGMMAAVNAQIANMVEFARLWEDASADAKQQVAEILDWRELRKVLRHARNSNEFRTRAFGAIYNSVMGLERERAP
jgi:hypothetical protein